MADQNLLQWALGGLASISGAFATLAGWSARRQIKRVDKLEAEIRQVERHVDINMVARPELETKLSIMSETICRKIDTVGTDVKNSILHAHQRIDKHTENHGHGGHG